MGYLVFFIGLFLLSSALNVVGITDILSTNLSALASHQGFFHIFMLWITAILTAIFGAVSTVAVLIPIIRTITMDYGTPLDIWWAISIGASFGGSITITGDATNMVGFGMMEKYMKARVTYFEFLRFSLPPALIALVGGTIYSSQIRILAVRLLVHLHRFDSAFRKHCVFSGKIGIRSPSLS